MLRGASRAHPGGPGSFFPKNKLLNNTESQDEEQIIEVQNIPRNYPEIKDKYHFFIGNFIKDHVQFRLFIDAASVELFVDNGMLVITSLVFPSETFNRLQLFSSDGEVLLEKAEFYHLKGIW